MGPTHDQFTCAVHHMWRHVWAINWGNCAVLAGFYSGRWLCKSVYFSQINCAVSPVNRTVSSVRTRSSSIRYRNEEKQKPFSFSLRDEQSSIHFSKRVAQCLQQAYSILLLFCRSIVVQWQPSATNKKIEKKSRGETVKRPTPSVQITVQIFTQFWAQENCTVKLKVYEPLKIAYFCLSVFFLLVLYYPRMRPLNSSDKSGEALQLSLSGS